MVDSMYLKLVQTKRHGSTPHLPIRGHRPHPSFRFKIVDETNHFDIGIIQGYFAFMQMLPMIWQKQIFFNFKYHFRK
jgi:hypothetical protein